MGFHFGKVYELAIATLLFNSKFKTQNSKLCNYQKYGLRLRNASNSPFVASDTAIFLTTPIEAIALKFLDKEESGLISE
ncbi:hypothetical protein [Kamptonema formosum]|nr:hypothetical protein [Kamptonema formosum]